MSCLLCDGTGITCKGTPCPECSGKIKARSSVLRLANIPYTYQGRVFNKNLLPYNVSEIYKNSLQYLYEGLIGRTLDINNILICSPIGHGKTVWSYSLYAEYVEQGRTASPIVDLLEARQVMNDYQESQERDLLSYGELAVIRIPRDITGKFANIIATIIDRRVRNSGKTIFLYNGRMSELLNIDTTGSLKDMLSDGLFTTIKVYSYFGEE